VRIGINTGSYAKDAPQRFHAGDIPRLGGVGILLGLIASVTFTSLSQRMEWAHNFNARVPWLLTVLACVLPVFLVGLAEDWTHRIGIHLRFIGALASAVMACWLLDLKVVRLDVPGIDMLMEYAWFSIGFTLIAVAGLPNAFNIIDGYNGLAAMVAVLLAGAIAYVALLNGDRELATLSVALVGSSLGFLFWNYPRGSLFAGDCGAYLWGVLLAILAITLVQRHASVSPWFIMLLFSYPVSETLFSMYRKWVRGQSASMADSMHFHQLVYKRIVRGVFHDDETRQLLTRNNRTSPYMWAMCALTVVPAVLFWNKTLVLMVFCSLFVITYVGAYLMIVRFKVPRWIAPKAGGRR
jgi:UDP-GlcNAc:undecaprenyl-phosphate/decaprenyl-phosphate GlcNAc-1-phosphate transferase